jgi:hypothetical protein
VEDSPQAILILVVAIVLIEVLIGLRLQLSAEDKTLPSQQFNASYDGVTSTTSQDANGNVVRSLLRNTNSARA